MESQKAISLSNQITRVVVLPLILAVLLLCAVQGYLFYQASLERSRQQLDIQISQVLPALSKGLYDADLESINLIGDSLFRNEHIEYLMISDQFSRIYLRNRNLSTHVSTAPIVLSKPLSYTNTSGQRLLLGNLTIHFNHSALLMQLQETGLLLVALDLLKLLLPLIALFIFLRRKVQNRINNLIDRISQSRPDDYQPVQPRANDPKEITDLITSYNLLQENNYRYHTRQQEAHNKLMERTQEVAEGRESARLLTNMLQNSQKRYRALFHRNVDALLIVESFRLEEEERYRIIDANQTAVGLLSQPLEQLIKQDFEVMFGCRPLEHGSSLLTPEELPASLYRAGIYIELHFNMVMYEKQVLYYVTLRDVSDKLRAEKLEQEAQELMNFRQNQMAIAEMATNIAHEINQPLAAIQNYALAAINYSKGPAPNDDKLHQSLEQLVQQSDIASDIVRQARAQLGRNDYPHQAQDLLDLLNKSIDLCRFRAQKEKVRITLDTSLECAPIIANDVQIKQVLINLIANGLEILSEKPPAGTPQIRISLQQVGRFYDIRVQDNGPGIDNIPQVFTTHYSTKEQGLGMGLAICRSITEIHQGSISAHNVEEGGAVFVIRLPVTEPEGQKQNPAVMARIQHSGT